MRNQQALHPLLRTFLYAFLAVLLILLLVGVIHLLAGWQTIQQYGSGLVWVGGIGAILLLVGTGWRDNRRQDMAALSQVMREHEVFYLLNRDHSGRARFLFGGLIALVITFAIGLILRTIP